ncbi:MAG: AraC family transcriptional regulator [Spirochaetes bacterium]|nr:MAG: AraC family transcriptional regulator [Spirochaetota bacterium]
MKIFIYSRIRCILNPMYYTGRVLKKEFSIDKIFSIHYFEFVKDYSFKGEKHNFWEFVYIDKGAILATAGDKTHTLIKGDIIFHKPNEFHDLNADGHIAPNIVIMSFSSRSPGMKWFENRIMRIGNEEKNLLARILHEAGNAFASPLSDPWLPALERKKEQIYGSEHLIQLYLEQILIGLVRREMHIGTSNEPESPLKEKTSRDAFNKVILFFENHVTQMPSLEKVCRETGYSCTYIENVFKEKTGRSVMEYYKITKLEKAKDLIREGNYTFTQIAAALNYSSIHYFSKVFKKYIGMTPTEYSSSVKLKL